MQSEQISYYLDLELLQGYLDSLGKAIVEKMLALYSQQSKIYLHDIEQAQLNSSFSDWQEHCHKMKGATASVGMHQLHGQLKLLEQLDAPKEKKAVLLAELKLSNEQATLAFKRWLESK
jgi:HPt (histidine-containing phosphotransfer) domain-containing protein